MSNPNNCETCQHRQAERLITPGSAAWCYMFKDEPTAVCEQHTGRGMRSFFVDLAQLINRMPEDYKQLATLTGYAQQQLIAAQTELSETRAERDAAVALVSDVFEAFSTVTWPRPLWERVVAAIKKQES